MLLKRNAAGATAQFLTPTMLETGSLPHGPFVFLNACQVASDETVLGDYAGFASTLLRIGAGGVVAPLWNVRDDVAKEVARSFYAATLGADAVSTAEAMRAVRATYTEDGARSRRPEAARHPHRLPGVRAPAPAPDPPALGGSHGRTAPSRRRHLRRGRRDPHPRADRGGRGLPPHVTRHARRGAHHRGVPPGARRRRPRRAALGRDQPAPGDHARRRHQGQRRRRRHRGERPRARRRQRPGAAVRRRGRLAVLAPGRGRPADRGAGPRGRAAHLPHPAGRRTSRRAGRRRPPRHRRRHRQEGPQGPGLPAGRPGARQGRRPLRPQVGGQEPAQPGALDARRRLPEGRRAVVHRRRLGDAARGSRAAAGARHLLDRPRRVRRDPAGDDGGVAREVRRPGRRLRPPQHLGHAEGERRAPRRPGPRRLDARGRRDHPLARRAGRARDRVGRGPRRPRPGHGRLAQRRHDPGRPRAPLRPDRPGHRPGPVRAGQRSHRHPRPALRGREAARGRRRRRARRDHVDEPRRGLPRRAQRPPGLDGAAARDRRRLRAAEGCSRRAGGPGRCDGPGLQGRRQRPRRAHPGLLGRRRRGRVPRGRPAGAGVVDARSTTAPTSGRPRSPSSCSTGCRRPEPAVLGSVS